MLYTLSMEWITQDKKPLLGENQAKTKAVAAGARRVAVTERRATSPGIEVPATSTEHATEPIISTCRINL